MHAQVTSFIKSRINISDKDLEWSLKHNEVLQFKKGDFLLRVGEICDYVGFINKGILMSGYYDQHGKEKASSFHSENCFFTHTEGLSLRVESTKFIIVLEDVEILKLKKDKLSLIIKNQPIFGELFNLILAEDLRIMYEQNTNTQILSAEERYLLFVKNSPHLVKRIPQKYIASYLGIEPQSLSRVRKKLSKTIVGH